MHLLSRPTFLARSGAAALLIAAGIAAAMTGTASAQAVCPTSTLTLSPVSGPAGTGVEVSGTHFSGCSGRQGTGPSNPPSSTLTVSIGISSGDTLGTATTQPDGSFSATVMIPATTSPGAGQIAAVANDPSTGRQYLASAPFTVKAAMSTQPAPASAKAAAPASKARVIPRSVPAGSGGSAPTSVRKAGELIVFALIGSAGVVLSGAGAYRLKRN